MENDSKVIIDTKLPNDLALQDYLSIGYVFLLVLGVFHETIYYKFLGVNILEYSSILDVLISPIAVLFGNLILGLAVIVVLIFTYSYLKLLPKYYKWLETKNKYQDEKNKIRLEKSKAALKNKNGPLFIISVYVFALFIGLGIGRGYKTNDKIDKGDVQLTHIITFSDGQQQKIKMLGKNSLYVFYVTGGREEVSIAPIDSNIHLIQNLK